MGGVLCPEGRFSCECLPAPARPCFLAPNQPAAARTKGISWGPPPCSSIRKGGTLYGWKNRGILAVVGMGLRGLRVCSHIGHMLTPLPHACKPDGGRGPLIAGCWSPAGFKGWRGCSPGQRGLLDPREPRESSPALASVAPVASTGSFHGAMCCSPGPRFSAGECLLHTPRKGGRGCLVGGVGGFDLWRTEVVAVTVPSPAG